MHDLLAQVRHVLESAGFAVNFPAATALTLDFEDASVMGRVFAIDRPETIALEWRGRQDAFLLENASRFQRDPMKAWNLYTVFLSPQPHSEIASGALLAVEEDFRGTRKIARGGIGELADIEATLSPLLPLRTVRPIGVAETGERLKERLTAIAPALVGATEGVAAGTIAGRLLASQ